MTTSTELAKTTIVTQDGVVTATLVDRVGPDRVTMMLMRGNASARYAGQEDQTEPLSRDLRALLVNPRPDV